MLGGVVWGCGDCQLLNECKMSECLWYAEVVQIFLQQESSRLRWQVNLPQVETCERLSHVSELRQEVQHVREAPQMKEVRYLELHCL